MFERVFAKVSGVARLDCFSVHACTVDLAVRSQAPFARSGTDQLGVQVLCVAVTHVQFPDHVLDILRREPGGHGFAVGMDYPGSQPVVGVEPRQVLEGDLFEGVDFLDHFHHLVAHASHACIGDIG